MAPCGQVTVQMPQPWQTVSMTSALGFPERSATSLMAPNGQVLMHLPQPTQRATLTLDTAGSDCTIRKGQTVARARHDDSLESAQVSQ